ncbi:MAG: AAA family ATPase [Phreatobacter sp.]|nr:AAA family ATPase [Phreatobacter sp.]
MTTHVDDFVAVASLAPIGRAPLRTTLPEEPAGMDRYHDDPGPSSSSTAAPNPSPSPRVALSPTPAAALAELSVPDREWAVADLIPARNVTILSGDGAVGKSLLGLQLSFAAATGTQWIGLDVTPGKALFLTAEDEMPEVHRRLHAIGSYARFPLAEVHDLHLLSLAGLDAVLAIPDAGRASMQATPLFRQLEALVLSEGYSMVILDTLADLFGGDEINRVHARQFIGMLRGLALRGCAIVMLAHPSQSGMSRGDGASGSTAWNNSVRSRLYLMRPRTDDTDEGAADGNVRVLQVVKANYGPAAMERTIRWCDGVFVPEHAPGGVGGTIGAHMQSEHAENVFLALLRTYIAEGRNVTDKGPSYGPAIFAKDLRAEGFRKAALTGAMNRLFEKKKIRVETSGPASRRRSRIVLCEGGTGA